MSYQSAVFEVVLVEELFDVQSEVGVIVYRVVRRFAMVSEVLQDFRGSIVGREI